MKKNRVRLLKEGDAKKGPVVYWMSRDQRVRDNWALVHARDVAQERQEPLIVVFCLVQNFLDATGRHYAFMLRGLQEVEEDLFKKNIPFGLVTGLPEKEIPRFVKKYNAALLVCDFDPLRVKMMWKDRVAEQITIPFYEVDAHNIVPCWHVSHKQEFAARTFRPRIHRRLDEFLDRFPRIGTHPFSCRQHPPRVDWERAARVVKIDRSVSEISWPAPGEAAARGMMRRFITTKLASYDTARNDPTLDGQSGLSPYLHFGQIAAQRVVLEIGRAAFDPEQTASFLEELVVRRELSDNFCFYNPWYDSFKGFPAWAQKTLQQHAPDRREYLYSRAQLEHADTHDPLWNAAQMEMVKTGKMHGYMRMYWAKKILEWSESPEEALERAVYLNNRCELDGRDPNGYVGCAWSIGGVHDRAWFERPVFGKIRYMSYNGCRSKFNVALYIEHVKGL